GRDRLQGVAVRRRRRPHQPRRHRGPAASEVLTMTVTTERRFRAYARRTDYNQRVEVLFGFERPDGGFDHGEAVFKPLEPGCAAPPTVSLRPEQAQHLMDALWE